MALPILNRIIRFKKPLKWSLIMLLLMFSVNNECIGQIYQGYRLYLFNIHKIDSINVGTLVCDIANTGRFDLDLGIADPDQSSVLIQFEEDQDRPELDSLLDPIFCGLVAQSFRLEKGDYIKDVSIQVDQTQSDRKNCLMASDEKVEGKLQTPPGKDAVDALKAQCSDLIFSELELIRLTKRKAKIKYSIANTGNSHFRTGDPAELVVTFFLSGTEKMSKGAIPLGGAYLEPTKGQMIAIAPGVSFSGYLEIDIRKKTRYLNYLIFQVDPQNRYEECDDLNNIRSIFINAQ